MLADTGQKVNRKYHFNTRNLKIIWKSGRAVVSIYSHLILSHFVVSHKKHKTSVTVLEIKAKKNNLLSLRWPIGDTLNL